MIATSLRTAALAAALVLALGGSRAALAESSRNMMLELHGGPYVPSVDDQFVGATPWDDVFGSSGLTVLRFHIDYQFWHGFGSLAAGAGAGYGWVNGHAISGDGTEASDEVGFNLVPLTASLVYRWDWAAIKHGVPLVPYGKFGFTAGIWWATNGKDEISNTRGPDGEGREGRGLTLGWHVAGGLQFLLDVLSPGMASDFDYEVGINNSYLFAEISYTNLNDFGSDASIDLSSLSYSFGLMFEF